MKPLTIAVKQMERLICYIITLLSSFSFHQHLSIPNIWPNRNWWSIKNERTARSKRWLKVSLNIELTNYANRIAIASDYKTLHSNIKVEVRFLLEFMAFVQRKQKAKNKVSGNKALKLFSVLFFFMIECV